MCGRPKGNGINGVGAPVYAVVFWSGNPKETGTLQLKINASNAHGYKYFIFDLIL
jgi:hypothetical protein